MLHRDLTGADLHINKLHAATHLVGGTDPLPLIPGPQGLQGDTGSTGAAGTTDYTALSNKPTLGTAAALNVDADIATLALSANTTISAAGAELINDADAAAQRVTLGGVVVGPASFTDHAIVRADGVTGKLVQNSSVTIDDTGRMETVDVTGQGAVTVLVNGAAAVNDQVAGHYAFAAKNSAGNFNTVASIMSSVDIITETDMQSKLSFNIMSHQDTSGGYSQPQFSMIFDRNGLVVPGSLTVNGVLISAAGLALIDDANVAAQLATLGTAAYGEGTWTPTLGGFTIVGSAPAAEGTWKKIGKLALITCVIHAGAGGNTSVAALFGVSNIALGTVPGVSAPGLFNFIVTNTACVYLGTGGANTGYLYPPTFSAQTTNIVMTATYNA